MRRTSLVFAVLIILAADGLAQACTPSTKEAACAHKYCGTAFNGTCDDRIDCGPCAAGLSCSAINQCVPGACSPETDERFCARSGAECGAVEAADSCGDARRVASCGACTTGQSCWSGKCLYDEGQTQCLLGVSEGSNVHGQNCALSSYPYELGFQALVPGCFMTCRELPIGTACKDTETTMMELKGTPTPQGVTNAHAAIAGEGWGTSKICCQFDNGAPSYSTVPCGNLSCAWQTQPCSPGNTTAVRLNARRNAHMAIDKYDNHLCCEIIFQCDDGVDNDGDGFVDCAGCAGKEGVLKDPGCSSSMDNSERSFLTACDNGVDDDGDGLTDYRAPGVTGRDPGCTDPSDDDELDEAPRAMGCTASCTETQNGIDTGICREACEGNPAGCPAGGVIDVCDGRWRGSSVSLNTTHYTYCCAGGESFPNIDARNLRFETDRDIVRMARVRRTTQGDSIVLNINSFR